jgi:hypothetical protein
MTRVGSQGQKKKFVVRIKMYIVFFSHRVLLSEASKEVKGGNLS